MILPFLMTHQPVDIVRMIYRSKPHELDSKNYEWTRAIVQEHRQAGERDMRTTMAHPEWLRSAAADGVTTFAATKPGSGKVRRLGPNPEAGA